MTVFSLNHDNPMSFGFTHTPIFQKLAPSYLHMYYSVRVNPYAHQQHIKVLSTLYAYYMDVVYSLKPLADETYHVLKDSRWNKSQEGAWSEYLAK